MIGIFDGDGMGMESDRTELILGLLFGEIWWIYKVKLLYLYHIYREVLGGTFN